MMQIVLLVVGWLTLLAGGIAAAAGLLLGASALLRYAMREAMASIDLWQAIDQWKRANPSRSKRYDGPK